MRAQILSQHNRFAQQSPRGWFRAAEHAILGAQLFSLQVKSFVVHFFSPPRRFFSGCLFCLNLSRRKKQNRYLVFRRIFAHIPQFAPGGPSGRRAADTEPPINALVTTLGRPMRNERCACKYFVCGLRCASALTHSPDALPSFPIFLCDDRPPRENGSKRHVGCGVSWDHSARQRFRLGKA